MSTILTKENKNMRILMNAYVLGKGKNYFWVLIKLFDKTNLPIICIN